MQALEPVYADVVAEVRDFLRERLAARARCRHRRRRVSSWIRASASARPPAHNLALLRRQPELAVLGRPLLLGWSRKSTLGHADRPAGAAIAWPPAWRQRCWRCTSGARVVRVHDVAATVDALKVWQARTMSAPDRGRRTTQMSRRYFGTDGIRGTVGTAPITPDFMLRLGHAVGRVLRRATGSGRRC